MDNTVVLQSTINKIPNFMICKCLLIEVNKGEYCINQSINAALNTWLQTIEKWKKLSDDGFELCIKFKPPQGFTKSSEYQNQLEIMDYSWKRKDEHNTQS